MLIDMLSRMNAKKENETMTIMLTPVKSNNETTWNEITNAMMKNEKTTKKFMMTIVMVTMMSMTVMMANGDREEEHAD